MTARDLPSAPASSNAPRFVRENCFLDPRPGSRTLHHGIDGVLGKRTSLAATEEDGIVGAGSPRRDKSDRLTTSGNNT
jgi:hypothetical protein